MKARPHLVFFRSQHTVKFDLPNDVFYDLMALSKQLNMLIKNDYRLTPDDIFCMALEDFSERYLGDVQALLKRVEGT